MSSRSTRGLDIGGQGQVETCAKIVEGVYHKCYSIRILVV
jgi:hypothetical protein